MSKVNNGTLYVVATPIGNLEDITLRALRILREVEVIVCEDTRVTQKLLNHYEISNQLFSWHANSSSNDLTKVLNWLNAGKQVALVTDAGTPGISDPGMLMVQQVQTQLPHVKVVAIPGASALTTALSISGISTTQFLWLGFLPHKKGRQTIFKEIAEIKRPVVFYESPHRIEKTLHSIAEFVPTRTVVIARELTKIHEEVVKGTANELLQMIDQGELIIKGEFVMIIG